ncbi:MAG: hypothetical protein KF775_18055 [Cyclobacteriaceae bacterium]|nr:hypothetical protein [Cyclobacteriaceae bacterium]
MYRVRLTVALLLLSLATTAQDRVDSLRLNLNTDTARMRSQKVIEIESYASRFDPRKALLFSAVFPGTGQLYNKKYWKIPLVYGGFVINTAVIVFYDRDLKKYQNDLFYTLNNNLTRGRLLFTTSELRRAVDIRRRQRDFHILISGIWYIIQIVDAHVDAHLKEFQLNPKLLVKWEFQLEENLVFGKQANFGLKLLF